MSNITNEDIDLANLKLVEELGVLQRAWHDFQLKIGDLAIMGDQLMLDILDSVSNVFETFYIGASLDINAVKTLTGKFSILKHRARILEGIIQHYRAIKEDKSGAHLIFPQSYKPTDE